MEKMNIDRINHLVEKVKVYHEELEKWKRVLDGIIDSKVVRLKENLHDYLGNSLYPYSVNLDCGDHEVPLFSLYDDIAESINRDDPDSINYVDVWRSLPVTPEIEGCMNRFKEEMEIINYIYHKSMAKRDDRSRRENTKTTKVKAKNVREERREEIACKYRIELEGMAASMINEKFQI